jgi:F-type H+-transporting ATPase subunit b
MEFNLYVFVLQSLTFVVGMYFCSLIFLPKLRGWMDSRQKSIEEQLATAEKRQKESEALKVDFEKKVKELEQNTIEILQKTRQEAAQSRDEAIQAARKEAGLILADARKAIESEKQQLTKDLQIAVGTLAVSIAEKIIRSSVDAKAQEKLINENVQELTLNKN